MLQLVRKPKRLYSILSFNKKGYLYDIGWFKSFDRQTPVDANNRPIPWVTYSFIDFITDRLTAQHSIFEFGSGNSSYFYAKHAGKVVSVEHDQGWLEKVNRNKPDNLQVIYCELKKDGAYCRTPETLGEQFDIIIVDGRDRVNCCKHAINSLTDGGVVVLDDSERASYKPAVNFLMKNGFRHIPFSGISPGLFYLKSTSVFYKPGNCLGI
jgi:hypothetical protein